MLAVSRDDKLWEQAWQRNVLLVSPSTLLFVLRTVASLWRQEQQKHNVEEIARRGAELYNKLAGFVADFTEMGKRLEQAQTSYAGALAKLHTGPGNVIRQAEMLKALGVKPTKQIPQGLIELAQQETLELEDQPELRRLSPHQSPGTNLPRTLVRGYTSPQARCRAPASDVALVKRVGTGHADPSNPPQSFPRTIQRLRKHPRLPNHGHEVGIAQPPRQGMHVQVRGNPGPRRLAQVQSHVDPLGCVHLAQNRVGSLRQRHHLERRRLIQRGQRLLVGIRHDHDVTGSVREGIQANKAMLCPKHNMGRPLRILRGHAVFDREPGGGDQVTKDAVTVTGPRSQRLGHAFAPTFRGARVGIDQVSVAPGRPQIVHAVQVYGVPGMLSRPRA